MRSRVSAMFDQGTFAANGGNVVLVADDLDANAARPDCPSSPSPPDSAAATAGSLIGGHITALANPQHLSRAFAGLLIVVALYTAARSLPTLP